MGNQLIRMFSFPGTAPGGWPRDMRFHHFVPSAPMAGTAWNRDASIACALCGSLDAIIGEKALPVNTFFGYISNIISRFPLRYIM